MTEKFTYYIDFGLGFEKVDTYENKILFSNKITEDINGMPVFSLPGSFTLQGIAYDKLQVIMKSSSNKNIPFRVFRDEDEISSILIFDGYFNNYNDFDYDEKTATIKNFFESKLIDKYIAYIDTEYPLILRYSSMNLLTALPIYCNTSYEGMLITNRSYTLCDVINTLNYNNGWDIGFFSTCDPNDFWYNPANAKFDAKKYRIADLNSIGIFSQKEFNKISLKKIFEALEIIHKIYWYISDLGTIKFKTVDELCTSNIDLSEDTKNLNQVKYNYGLNFIKESITFNENNTILEGADYEYSNNILYQNLAKTKKDYSLTNITTRYCANVDGFNRNGFFFAYVDEITHKMIAEPGAKSGLNIDNARFSPANIMYDTYRDYMYGEDQNFKCNGVQSLRVPHKIKDFIELPPIQLVLENPEKFIDSVKWNIEPGNVMTARVMEQITDLNTNITTLKCVVFSNSKNIIIPPPPPPPPPPPTHYITALPPELSFNENSINGNVQITSDTDWTISTVEDWITFNKSSGTGNDTITVYVTSTTTNRVGTIIITDGNINTYVQISQTVTIIITPIITVSPAYHEVDRNSHIIQVSVITTEAWTLSNSNNWVHFSAESGTGNATLTMTIDSSTVDRSGNVVFSIFGSSYTLHVSQIQIVTALTVDPLNLNFSYINETKTFNIYTTGDWQIGSSKDWCTVDAYSGTGNATISVTCSATNDARTAQLTITNGTVTRNIGIVQDGLPAYVSVYPILMNFNENGGSVNISINSNTDWTCSAADSFVTLNKFSGTGNDVVTVTMSSSLIARTSSIEVTNGITTINIPVNQIITVVTPTIQVSPGYNNILMSGGSVQITITTTEQWTINNNLSWVHFSANTGFGNATITMTADYSAVIRSGAVLFYIFETFTSIYIYQS
jgi:hypothetical protein